MDTILFKNDVEKNQHENAIEVLCDQFPDRCGLIRTRYEKQLSEILPEATIRSYLPIFITRRIRHQLEDEKTARPN